MISEEDETVFDIVPFEGTIEGNETIKLKIIFNPTKPGKYTQSMGLFLESESTSEQASQQPYLVI